MENANIPHVSPFLLALTQIDPCDDAFCKTRCSLGVWQPDTWASSPLVCQGDPEVEDCIYPNSWGCPGRLCANGGGGERPMERSLNHSVVRSAPPGPVFHQRRLEPQPTAVIYLQWPLAFVLSARIKSGKMVGKVLARGFLAKLN